MPNVTKHDLISTVVRETGINAGDVKISVETLFPVLIERLSKDERLEIRGFGSLYMKKRKAKLVRNPKRPQDTKVLPQRWSPVLRFSKELKAAINRPHSSAVEKKGDFYFVNVLRDFVDTEIEIVGATVEDLIGQGVKNIVIDFEKVRYIYSPGLSGLVRFQRLLAAKGGQFYIVNVKPNVLSKLESVNLHKAVPLFRDKQTFELQNLY